MSEISEYDRATLEQLANLQPDWLLRTLVSLANKGNFKIGVTLVVGGSLISGQIIGGREYFTRLGEQFGQALGMSAEEGRDIWKETIQEYYPEGSLSRDEQGGEGQTSSGDDTELPPPGYIHLANARAFHGATQIPERHLGILWRGRLAAVEGFILGELSRST